jgi:hypothetical protein
LTEHGDQIGGGTVDEFAAALQWYVEAEPVGDHLQRCGVALAPLPGQ